MGKRCGLAGAFWVPAIIAGNPNAALGKDFSQRKADFSCSDDTDFHAVTFPSGRMTQIQPTPENIDPAKVNSIASHRGNTIHRRYYSIPMPDCKEHPAAPDLRLKCVKNAGITSKNNSLH